MSHSFDSESFREVEPPLFLGRGPPQTTQVGRFFAGELMDNSRFSEQYLEFMRECLSQRDRLAAFELLGHPIFM